MTYLLMRAHFYFRPFSPIKYKQWYNGEFSYSIEVRNEIYRRKFRERTKINQTKEESSSLRVFALLTKGCMMKPYACVDADTIRSPNEYIILRI